MTLTAHLRRILEVLHLAFGSHAIYYYVILHYGDPAALAEGTWYVPDFSRENERTEVYARSVSVSYPHLSPVALYYRHSFAYLHVSAAKFTNVEYTMTLMQRFALSICFGHEP